MPNHLARLARGRVGRVVIVWSLWFAVGGAARPARAQTIYFPILLCLAQVELTFLDCRSDSYFERMRCEVEHITDFIGCFSGAGAP